MKPLPIVRFTRPIDEATLAKIKAELADWRANPQPLVIGPGLDVEIVQFPARRRPFGFVAALAHRVRGR